MKLTKILKEIKIRPGRFILKIGKIYLIDDYKSKYIGKPGLKDGEYGKYDYKFEAADDNAPRYSYISNEYLKKLIKEKRIEQVG